MTHLTVHEKAQRLIDQDRVTEQPSARVFRVQGSDGRHTVVLGEVPSCSCPAGQHHRLCSHLLAAGLVAEREAVVA